MRKFVVIALLVAAVGVIAGCGPAETPGVVSRVEVMGDSNVWLSSDALLAAWANQPVGVIVDGHPGYGACDAQNAGLTPPVGPGFWQNEVATAAADPNITKIVVQLGINDVQGNDPTCVSQPGRYDAVIDSIVNAAGSKPVYWAGYRSDYPLCVQPRVSSTVNLCVVLNTLLDEAQARHPNLHYLDEDAAFNGHGEDFGTCDSANTTVALSGPQYVHFNCKGQVVFANWLHAQTS